LKPLSIYIHIPFCKQKCLYCDFLSFSHAQEIWSVYIEALQQELVQKSAQLQEYTIQSIFFGGGTPSLLPTALLQPIFSALYHHYTISPSCEITLESNPGTLDSSFLKDIRQLGVNRLSIGVQAWQNHLLKKIGRIHTIEQFLENYYAARNVGFDNINLDLMFALPEQSLSHWEETLNHIVSLQPEHISAYSLIVEPDTPLYELYHQKKMIFPDDTLDREMYHLANDILSHHGYHRYEISNFAQKGNESYHNQVYWKTQEYIGFGLGAHSYLNGTRFHNTCTIKTYLDSIHDFSLQIEEIEPLTKTQQYEEFMFMGLRMTEGVSEKEFWNRFQLQMQDVYGDTLKKLISQHLLQKHGDSYSLTLRGIDVSNYVFEKFI
jgi:oxygen-independent coproporphyrinogen-3 oxidase